MSAPLETAQARYTALVVYTQADFAGFMRAYTHKTASLRALGAFSKIAFRLAGALLIFAGGRNLVFFFREGAGMLPAAYAAVPLALMAAGVFLLLRQDSALSARLMWRRYPDKGSAVAYAFFDADFTASMPGRMNRLAYGAVEAVYADRARWYLFTGGNSGHIIAKEALAPKGNAQAFSAFLREKTGREIVEI